MLHIVEGHTDSLLRLLETNELHAALVSRTIPEEPYAIFSVFEEPLVLMASKKNEICKKTFVSVNDLDEKKLIFMEKGNCLRDDIIRTCKVYDSSKVLATSLETLRYLVSAYGSYAIIPKLSALHNNLFDKMICYIPFKNKHIMREIVLVCRKNYAPSKNILQLKNFFRDVVHKNILSPDIDNFI